MLGSSETAVTKGANKRLKVGRACYTCRAKKIKSRQRPCSFYKDGSLESDQQEPPNETVYDNMDGFFDSSSSRATKDNDDHILFADTSSVNHNKLKRRGPLMESRISNTLGALGENLRKMSSADSSRLAEKLLNTTDSYGSFIMWMPEPSLPSRYSGSIEMPSREIQMALIDQFFSQRYECIAYIPRHHFYEQIKTKGLLITPLLLNTIYAHAARFVDIPDCPKTEVFYQRARRLIDDFLDVPRISTVVALCLLSLYESSPSIYRPGSLQCRQWQYSGMACRMALELGLHDDTNVHNGLSSVDIELRRRVFWGCYDLDKFQSGGWERPWMISGCYIKTMLPSILPEETEDDLPNTSDSHLYNSARLLHVSNSFLYSKV
ncbi:fungal-specific transcription factor domain-containing protein [Choanephora cucurbitarum]|nr:fungal-specific transcription factor domain-containing protein [Choanephora cucurbitarum]